MKIVRLILLLAFLTACGSGGGVTGTAVDPGTDPEPVATKAVVTIRTQAASTETLMDTVELVLTLPPGVTVTAQADGVIPAGIFETHLQMVDGSNQSGDIFGGARYEPPLAGSPARVRVQLAGVDKPFLVGPLATLTCNIADGAAVTPAQFTITQFVAQRMTEGNLLELPGVTPRLSVQIK